MRHRAATEARAGVVRYYTFEQVTAQKPVAPSIAGESEPLSYVAKEPLQIVESRWPGKKAVRLDKGYFQAKPFEVKDKSFTVECWFRKHGQGSHLGNGRTNGMIIAQGDGYWSGLRVWTTNPTKHFRFEIGRPKPGHAFGLTADDPAPDGVWHHVAATWDGKEMRLYLNGLLLHAAPYAGEYTQTSGFLKVGFANAGVGSIVMDVDEVVVYDRALTLGDILRNAHDGAALTQPAQAGFEAADAAVARKKWAAAAQHYEWLTGMSRSSSAYRASARLALARVLRKARRTSEAVKQCVLLFGDESTPERLRQIAVRLCVPADRHAPNAAAPKEVYESLLALPMRDDETAIRLALAERCFLDDDAAGARKQYQALLETPDLSEREKWNARFQIAHTYLRAGDYSKARAEYEKIAGVPEAPSELKSVALLSAGNTFVKEKAYGRAADAFAKVRQLEDAPAHHRTEAEERLSEMRRLMRGLPARDPAATRVKLAPFPKPAVTFYVAPNGKDTNPGSQAQPFATLERARDAIRMRRPRNGGATVLVRGGAYNRRTTFELTESDSGTATAPIVYRACPGEKPRFTGGVRLRGFAPVKRQDILRRLPKESRDKVLCLNMATCGVGDYGEIKQRGYGFASRYPGNPWIDLYVDGKPMQLGRWPNEGFVKVGAVHAAKFKARDSRKPGVFEYDGDRPNRWALAKDVWMYGLWGHLWAGRTLKVASIDVENRRIATAHGSSYGFRSGQPYYYFNLLEEIDRPGEWHLDRNTGMLYLYPSKPVQQSDLQFPVMTAPFVKMENVSHVTIRGITFEYGRAEGAVISDGERCLLAGCAFRCLGTNGVLVRGGTGHGVLGCDIHTVGAGGVRVAGGDPKTLTPSGHFVENCHVHDFSRVDRAYAPAVHTDGVGVRIAHNLFHDSPHHAMRVEGYEHVIEYNEIHSVLYETDDQGGIDMWGNAAYRGNVMRHNFWHHIGSGHQRTGQSGIRLDDFISDVLVYGNVFWRCSGGRFGGIQIHGGKDNVADNNLFVECKYAFSFSPWGEKRWKERLAQNQSRILRGGVDITTPPHSTRYPDLAHLEENIDRNFVWRSVAVNCGKFTTRERGTNEMMDNCTFNGDPGFADLAKRDLTLKSDSPLLSRSAFRPIPFDEIGLYHDPLRASWPVEHALSPRYAREF